MARPRSAVSTLGIEQQEVICALSESRGISPTVGLAFINLDTCEVVLSQINDTQTYVRTIHKLTVLNPFRILITASSANPKSKLFAILEDSLDHIDCDVVLLDRNFWAENTGMEGIQRLSFAEDVESIKTAVHGNYYAICCFAAALKYVELEFVTTFPQQSLRISYEPSEGSMMIDVSTIRALELVQNLHSAKSRDCLFGLLNETLTPMGARLLRSNILQPLTDPVTLGRRYEALEELSTKEDMFFGVRQALKPFLDVDRTLTHLIIEPIKATLKDTEQAINNVMMLKHFVGLVQPVFDALGTARSEMLRSIANICAPENTVDVQLLIDAAINEDTTYARMPLDLRNQRTYAVKSGANGLLDVARQTYKEAMTDAFTHMTAIAQQLNLQLQIKFDNVRQFYFRLPIATLEGAELPAIFKNVIRRRDVYECQTLDLIKRNKKISDAHVEVLLMSDNLVQNLIIACREHMQKLFKICEGIALLDMLAGFAQVVTSQNYVRPESGDAVGIKGGRHPIREKIQHTKFVANDIYATKQDRFQIVTGSNMSGKSTYVRSVALMTVMSQVGSFVPAEYACLPIVHQLFARVSLDDSIEANVSTFAAEMREAAFILKNIDHRSMAIIDELGRGTSTRDGLAIALAVAEALVCSRAFVWFATHFRELSEIMCERSGVVSLHFTTSMREADRIEMLYQIAPGTLEERHYGLRLAKVVPLPADVVAHAEHVATVLEEQTTQQKASSPALVRARRRKLTLNLREHLLQAKNGLMSDHDMAEWLRDLQNEFVIRMTALDD